MIKPKKANDLKTWQPRFTVGLMLLVTFVFSVMGAAGYYFVQSIETGGDFRLGFILFTVASPLLLLVVVSCGRALFEWIQHGR